MDIHLTGRHIGVDGSERAYALGKIEALGRFHRHIQTVEVRVGVDGSVMERVEIDAGLGHHRRVASMHEGPDFRTAFDGALRALRRQIQKDKGRLDARRRGNGPAARVRRGGRTKP